MRRFLSIIGLVLILILNTITLVYAASVPPQTFPGNDSNPMDYTPPEGCIHYEIPNSGDEGTFTARFNQLGEVDPEGSYIFTVVIGSVEGESYTKVLSWSSNFPIYAVIVKGGNAFNLYQYDTSVREDTNLVSPDNASGNPADVSHVSIVICPDEFPPVPPCPPCPPCPSCPNCPSCPTCPSCPPAPPYPPVFNYCGIYLLITIVLIINFFLIGLLFASNIFCHRRCFYCKNKENKEDCCHKQDKCRKDNYCNDREYDDF